MKRFLSIIVMIVAVLMAASAQSKIFEPVFLAINSDDGRFAKGDTVKVYALLASEVSEQVRVTVVAAGKTISDEPVSLNVGAKTLIHSCAWDEPKSVVVNVFAESNPKIATSVGYVVAADEFTPGYEEPADLQEYWKHQIAAMRKQKIKAKMTQVDEDFKGSKQVDCYALEINMPEGNPVRAYVAIPKNASAKSLPIYMYAHSAGVNRKSNASTPVKAASMAKLGAIAIDINAHGMLNGQSQEYYDGLYEGELKNYEKRELTTRDEYYFRLMYLRLVRALDYLTTLKQWDGERVLISGESQGGGQAAALAGIDSRVTAAVMIVPALNDLGGSRYGRINGWPARKKYMKGEQKKLAQQILPYFDGALLVKHSDAKLFYEAGLIDMTCDPACVFASFNNAGSSDKQIYCYPYRHHGGTNKRYSDDWKSKILAPRTKFIKDYIGNN